MLEKDRETIEDNQRIVYPEVAWRTSGSRPDYEYADPLKTLRTSGSRRDCGMVTQELLVFPPTSFFGQINGNVVTAP